MVSESLDRHSSLPTGTVTFLFTDIEGSTRLIQALGDGYPAVLQAHRDAIEGAATRHGGTTFGSEGDALFIAFPDGPSAVAAAVDAQRALAGNDATARAGVAVRMGLHTGEALVVGQDYVGLALHRVARIAAAGHGGQVLVSETLRALAADRLPEGTALRDLGEHRLKDLARPEHLYQLVVPGLRDTFPPLRTIEVRPNNLPQQLTTFVGRSEVDAARGLLAGTRLLTLTGPGGTGKTRLALQLAVEAIDDFPDGVFFVPLDAVDDPGLVPSMIAQALALDTGADPPLDRIVEHLRSRRALLVLDNLEQVVDAARPSPGSCARQPTSRWW